LPAGGIHPTQHCGWKKQWLSSATKVFDEATSKPSAREARQPQELRRLKDVVAQITADKQWGFGKRRPESSRGLLALFAKPDP
jgi:hypothetical protein